jgi:hypothetical protein
MCGFKRARITPGKSPAPPLTIHTSLAVAQNGPAAALMIEGVYGVDAGDALAADERHRRMVTAP